ncbi:tRNA (5-methylaminomethyl-2-thiouridine)(34)-methyltransferase MnmD [Bacteroidales bacterium OttesenSCG-928-B11]|nr:tRNA (5-methylaminomethyl-2-thiouridine)(34)-methyltransferase MnmD [Bacteroidales bacterium OttesenSCG-928-C03]MDL2311824.1 tRNA (5-methylaminomethyl-2-thiouridine)(34)-methyltransferase MnmD [Bacteroidales bacterium OttesenSCG-928-B11]MDL2325527.1 tRNA (5-methylaminomethyl-2-thiouridine)(34)-methyltransferase MnmD [Bacteroidales bacterium OttesenSCG-928-A14]
MKDFTKRTITISEDGSSSLRIEGTDEHFHSVHGAYNESMHVYINAGLKMMGEKREIAVLDVGFGTGLNALLTLVNQDNRVIHYHGIEAYPLQENEFKALNYTSIVGKKWDEIFRYIHVLKSDDEVEISSNFFFKKSIIKLEDICLFAGKYDIVYFDAFSPDLQPELWSEEIFRKIYKAMVDGGILMTYCAKGWVKRVMKTVGFTVEGLPGPIGKREISRGVKVNNSIF